MKKYPFFICVDDGGFPYAEDDIFKPINPIPLSCYETLVEVAKLYQTRIPLAITLKYFDKPTSYIKELINLINNNRGHIEIAYHGLTHNIDGTKGEFRDNVSEDMQKQHLQKSKKIFDSLNWEFPKIFIPPYHLWSRDRTDKILKGYGVEFIVTAPFNKSRYLTVLSRGNLGIYSDDVAIPVNYIKEAIKYIVPTNRYNSIRFHRKINQPVFHSYITHIGNFSPPCLGFWKELLTVLKGRDTNFIPESNEATAGFIRNGQEEI